MKEMVLGSLLLLGVFAFAQKNSDLKTLGLKFVAPAVKDLTRRWD